LTDVFGRLNRDDNGKSALDCRGALQWPCRNTGRQSASEGGGVNPEERRIETKPVEEQQDTNRNREEDVPEPPLGLRLFNVIVGEMLNQNHLMFIETVLALIASTVKITST
jgi:hypothetical protein